MSRAPPRGVVRDIAASARHDAGYRRPAPPCRRRHERCSSCFPTMMRITRVPGTDGVARLHIEGRLTGDGVKELAASCEAYLAVRHPLLLDVADVTFVDREGLDLLEAVVRRGAALRGCSPFLDELLRDHRGGS